MRNKSEQPSQADAIIPINVIYLNGVQETTGFTLKGLLPDLLLSDKEDTILLVRLEFEKPVKLYFNSQEFFGFSNDLITYEELSERTWCDGLYRNIAEVTIDAIEIDTESLWLKRGDTLMLADDEQPLTCSFNTDLFYSIA